MKTLRFLVLNLALPALLLTTARAQPVTAGTLYVDLRATNVAPDLALWTNNGTLVNFTNYAYGRPTYSNNVAGTGIPGVLFNGTSDVFVGPTSVADLEGNSDRSIEVWVYNPAVATEETLVAWGRRGATRVNMSFNYGNSTSFGAAGHFADDVGWPSAAAVPAAGAWHHIVYVYNGANVASIYADGTLRTNRTLAGALVTPANFTINVGAQHTGTSPFLLPDLGQLLSGYINSVRVHGGQLTAANVATNYLLGPSTNDLPVAPLRQPLNWIAGEAGPANFTFSVLGQNPVTYQWSSNGVPIVGATSPTFSILNAPLDANGAVFSCVASNNVGGTPYVITSSNAVLTVASTTNALRNRYSFNGDASDSVGAQNGTVLGTANIGGGQVNMPGVAGSYVALPGRLIQGVPVLTLECWASFGVNVNNVRTFEFGNTNGTSGSRYVGFIPRGAGNVARPALIDGGLPTLEKTTTIANNFDLRTNLHIVAVYDSQSGLMAFYTNGVLCNQRFDMVSLTNVDNALSYLGRSVWAADGYLNGSIDEARIYGAPLSLAQIKTNFLRGPNEVIDVPATILSNPANVTASEEGAATFSITAKGSPAVSYQWYRNGSALAGATNRTVTLPYVIGADNGALLTCSISNLVAGTPFSTTSAPAVLTVVGAAASLSHRYSFTNDATDSIGTAHGSIFGNANISGGKLNLDGVVGSYMNLPGGLVSNLNSVTIEFWATYGVNGNWARVFDFGATNGTSGDRYMFFTPHSGNGGHRIAITDGAGANENLFEAAGLLDGLTMHVACVFDPPNGTISIYTNGVLEGQNTAVIRPLSGVNNVLSYVGRSLYASDSWLNGSIDEFRIYNSALSGPRILRSYQLGPNRTLGGGPPEFLVQPQSVTVTENQTASFSAIVDGHIPITLQWYTNGLLAPSATNNTFSLVTKLADNGTTFQLWATNTTTNGTFATGSSVATLTVLADTNPPTVVRVQNIGATTVEILFSEPMEVSVATALTNYGLDGVNISAAALDGTGRIVTLTTDPLTFGTSYTLGITNVIDRAFTPNVVTPNPTVVAFTAAPYAIADIGQPIGTSLLTILTNGYNITAPGFGATGSGDQLGLAYENRTGDFDVQLRLGSLNLSDDWARAGLLARNGFATNGTFAASFATPGPAGSFFASRTTTPGSVNMAGSFPVNYPNTWLRLRRVGNVFDGFASLDGATWEFLGSSTIVMPSTIQVGLAISSGTAGTTVAQFRDIGAGSGVLVTNAPLNFEPIGPSSRKTSLVISEIMYNPLDSWGGTNNLEWVEIYNSGTVTEDLTGHKLRGDISYDFANGTSLAPGAYLVVARNPGAFNTHYGQSALGPWSGNLGNNSGTLRLNNELGGRLLEVNYDNEYPWPVAADGTGHSLVLRRPSYGENDARAWGLSAVIGGSPGRLDPAPAAIKVVINEFLQSTNVDQVIELMNLTTSSLDLTGYILTDNASTNRYVIPAQTIPANGFHSFDWQTIGFVPNPLGGHLYLLSPGGASVVDAVEFGAYGGAPRGRFPNGSPYWSELSALTAYSTNAAPLQRELVINEIMYNPISGLNNDEYLEIYNRGTNAVNLSGWRLRGGIEFNFPTNASINPGAYIVVAENVTNLLAKYAQLNGTNTFGNYSGSLANGGERVALQMPVTIGTNATHTTVNEVTYSDGGRWGLWSDGGGSSLELTDPRADTRFGASWADSDESAKATWTSIDVTNILENGQTAAMINQGTYAGMPNRFEFFLQDSGEALVDDVAFLNNGGANLVSNPDFASGTNGFVARGTFRRSFAEAGVGIGGSQALRLVGTGRGDTGANKVQAALTANIVTNAPNTGTIRAQVRWLKGSPYIMFRTRGHWMEVSRRLNIPNNLGTPGLPNSRLVANAGPIIADATHAPVLPAVNQPVVVTARVLDADGVGSVALNYRVDPTLTYTTVAMNDAGTGGDALANDGVYSATIPGQASGTLAAFVITANDAAITVASNRFPSLIPTGREGLVRWGETLVPGSLGTYRLWVTSSNITFWTNRERNANDAMDATFVYGNSRVIYNVGTLYSGSPFHAPSYNGPLGSFASDYEVNFNPDEQFLGTKPFVLAAQDVSNTTSLFFADTPAQVDATANWIARKLGQQYNARRHVHVVVNGTRRGTIYEDTQQPNGDMLDEYFPNDSAGDLRKIEDWFEFADDAQTQAITTAYLTRFNKTTGELDTKHHRWNWKPRATDNPDDWFKFTNMIVAVNNTNDVNYASNVLNHVDMGNYLRPIVAHHITGDWDSYGYERGKNMFTYKPDNDGYRLLHWDNELGLGSRQSRAANHGIYVINNEPILNYWVQGVPKFAREYLAAFAEACNTSLAPGAADGLLDERYAALLANNVGVASPQFIKDFIAARRTYLLSILPAAAPFTVSGPGTSSTNLITLTGTAPLNVKNIRVNGRGFYESWTSVSNWNGTFRIASGTNVLLVTGHDFYGNVVASNTITVVFDGVYPWPQLRINEWMASNTGFIQDPADNGNDDWFELYNPTAEAVELGDWYLSDTLTNRLQYRVPSGYVIPAGGYLLVWADGQTGQNATNRPDLHANFSLRAAGEAIVLTAPDTTIIDSVTFGAQTANVSQGRTPDGSTNVITQPVATPRTNNYQNIAPVITAIGDKVVIEGETLAFNVTATDANNELFAFQLGAGAPAGASLDIGGAFSWTPTEAQGSNAYVLTVIVSDLGTPSLSSTQTFNVTVLETNAAPTLAPIANTNIVEGFALVLTNLATDGDLPANVLTFSLDTNAPAGAAIDPTNGVFTWTPSEAQGPGAFDISVIVTDGGTPSLSATQTFQVSVAEVNQAPALIVPADVSIDELATLTVTNLATDADAPANTLTFELLSGPSGALLDTNTGVLTWTPTEAQGPSSNAVVVRVFDNGTPSLSATGTFSIVVLKVNEAPTLAPISDHTLIAGTTLTFTNSAGDNDLPANARAFSLAAGSPAGAGVNATNGVFSWKPLFAQAPSTNVLRVIVSDDGTPSLTATQSFTVTVLSPSPVLLSILRDTTNVVLTWPADLGVTYRLEHNDDLNTTNWSPTASDVVATTNLLNSTQPVFTNRFYRVRLVE